MMIKILRDTAIKGAPVFKGDIVEVDQVEAGILISARRAEKVEEKEQENPEGVKPLPQKKKGKEVLKDGKDS